MLEDDKDTSATLLGEARGLTDGPPIEAGRDVGDPESESRRLARGRIREVVGLSDIELMDIITKKEIKKSRSINVLVASFAPGMLLP